MPIIKAATRTSAQLTFRKVDGEGFSMVMMRIKQSLLRRTPPHQAFLSVSYLHVLNYYTTKRVPNIDVIRRKRLQGAKFFDELTSVAHLTIVAPRR